MKQRKICLWPYLFRFVGNLDRLVENLPRCAVICYGKQHLHHTSEVLRKPITLEVFHGKNLIDDGFEQVALDFFMLLT